MTLDLNQLVSQATAAKIAGVSPQTLKYHVEQGHIDYAEVIDNRKFFDKAVIESWRAKRTCK